MDAAKRDTELAHLRSQLIMGLAGIHIAAEDLATQLKNGDPVNLDAVDQLMHDAINAGISAGIITVCEALLSQDHHNPQPEAAEPSDETKPAQ